jgi:hypothetical protein
VVVLRLQVRLVVACALLERLLLAGVLQRVQVLRVRVLE